MNSALRFIYHNLQVYLLLENTRSSKISWVANAVNDMEVEVLDGENKPVPLSTQAGSILSQKVALTLPPGSSLAWRVSHGGVSIAAGRDQYALIIGGKGWLIPKDSLASYSLRIRLRGYLGGQSPHGKDWPYLILDLPPTKIRLAR